MSPAHVMISRRYVERCDHVHCPTLTRTRDGELSGVSRERERERECVPEEGRCCQLTTNMLRGETRRAQEHRSNAKV